MAGLRRASQVGISAVSEALRRAAAGPGELHFKEGRDVVTDADVAVEDLIRSMVTRELQIPVVGEEGGGDAGVGDYWLVDPICGTRNYASGIPLYAINMALVESGSISVSVVGDASTGAVFAAESGAGAWRLDRGEWTRVKASPSSRIVNFDGWPEAEVPRDAAARAFAQALRFDRYDVRSLSTTLGLAYVAAGRIAGQVLFSTPALHCGAGALLATEAGAIVTDMQSNPWTIGSDSLIASADASLHEALVDLCRGVRP